MDIKRRIFDGEYNTAYTGLLKMNFQIDDFTVGMKGKTKVILGKENVTLLYGNVNEEMDYGSFEKLIDSYSELCNLLERKGFVKKPGRMGIDVYENRDEKIFVGRKVKIVFGKTKDKLTYDEAISVLTSY